ncbi:hypothetical protein [Streptomyces albipurpureus]|uniref:Secreted protein n=1 Tax=Streptomyces albipurpureus TaxID=2897419 RepID=A0ABT0UK39_9ACTN|nr:hypothetical protein [Streptomyces sp. CWNU-1]MCM2389014.1 hypothetical protein [Streptomyces sp. CWNU-1]
MAASEAAVSPMIYAAPVIAIAVVVLLWAWAKRWRKKAMAKLEEKA